MGFPATVLTHVLLEGPKLQMQLKKGSDNGTGRGFSQWVLHAGSVQGPAWASLARLLLSSLLEVGHPPEGTSSFQQQDFPSICRAGVLVSSEGDPYKHTQHLAGL